MHIQLERFAKLVHCIITRDTECNPFNKVLGRRCNQIQLVAEALPHDHVDIS